MCVCVYVLEHNFQKLEIILCVYNSIQFFFVQISTVNLFFYFFSFIIFRRLSILSAIIFISFIFLFISFHFVSHNKPHQCKGRRYTINNNEIQRKIYYFLGLGFLFELEFSFNIRFYFSTIYFCFCFINLFII